MTSTITGAPVTIPGLMSDIKSYMIGQSWDGRYFYVTVSPFDGSISTYNGNDQPGTIDYDAPKWDAPATLIDALYQSALREWNNSKAEDQRYRENVELRERIASLESAARNVPDRAAIMKEMMDRAAQIAEDEGFCSEYDRLANALGYEGREREYDVTVNIHSFSVTVRVTATSADNAYDEVTESEIDDAIRSYVSRESVSWDHYETERA